MGWGYGYWIDGRVVVVVVVVVVAVVVVVGIVVVILVVIVAVVDDDDDHDDDVIKNTSFIKCHCHFRPRPLITQDQPSTSDLSHDEIHGDGMENQGGGKPRLKKKKTKQKTTTKN